MGDKHYQTVERRAASVQPASWNAEERTIDVVWTTGATVRRSSWLNGDYDLELSLDPKSVRLGRLNDGAPFLDSHNDFSLGSVIGVVVAGSAKIANGVGTAKIRLSDAPSDADVTHKIASGIVRNISVGLNIHERVITKQANGLDHHLATDWEPFEISAVPMGADPGAHTRSAKQQEERAMPPKIDDTTVPPVTTVDPVAVLAADTERRKAIRTAGKLHGIADDLLCQWQDDPAVSVALANERILAAVAERDKATRTQGVHTELGATDDEKRAGAIRIALLHRGDPKRYDADYRKIGASDYRGMSLLDIGRECAERAGIATRGLGKVQLASAILGMRGRDHDEKRIGLSSERFAGPRLTTGDFPLILAEVANVNLRAGMEEEAPTYPLWTKQRSASDFRLQHELVFGDVSSLQKVNESGEFKRGTITEGDETWSLSTFGLILAFTRQLLIDDKIGALTTVPNELGMTIERNRGDVVYDLVTGNGPLSDNLAYFHATHGNLIDVGSGGAPSKAQLSLMRQLGRVMRGIGGNGRKSARMTHLIGPSTVETDFDDIIAQFVPAQSGETMPAAFRSLIPVIEPRLDDVSELEWYTAAAARDSLVWGTLDGEGVFTETRVGFEVDGVELKIRDDFGAGLIAPEGLYKNAGQ